MLRSLCIFTVAVALLLIGCADTPPDKREALKPEEKEPRYPGLEVNPPDVYEYMQTPSGVAMTAVRSATDGEPEK